MTSVDKFKRVTEEMNTLYQKKNSDYGDSFHTTFEKYGYIVSAIRIGDKFQRFETLLSADTINVPSESIRDTLIDLASYAVMTILELDSAEEQ